LIACWKKLASEMRRPHRIAGWSLVDCNKALSKTYLQSKPTIPYRWTPMRRNVRTAEQGDALP
jgi:hypothetical protein